MLDTKAKSLHQKIPHFSLDQQVFGINQSYGNIFPNLNLFEPNIPEIIDHIMGWIYWI